MQHSCLDVKRLRVEGGVARVDAVDPSLVVTMVCLLMCQAIVVVLATVGVV